MCDKILCPKCKGAKKVPDMLERVFTFGISWLLDKADGGAMIGWERCSRCKGKGYLKFN